MVAKYVITGGPGVGKTSVLEELALRGHKVVPEAARAIIETEYTRARYDPSHVPIIPQTHFEKFQEYTTTLQMSLEAALENTQTTTNAFLDRSLVDNVAYMELAGMKVPDSLHMKITDAKYTKVFFLASLAHYSTDNVRTEDAAQAELIHEKIGQVYRRMGYEVIDVPAFGIKERADFIVNTLGGVQYEEQQA